MVASTPAGDAFAYHLAQSSWQPPAETEVCFVSVAERSAPARGRVATRALLDGWLTPAQVGDALLLVSELMTNAVRHAPHGAGATVTLRLGRTGHCVRGEMSDDGPGFDVALERPRSTDSGGRGLLLVDALASRWGASMASGHCVWFELDV
ncbi:MAG: serine/threonine protein phosphatase [Conexibacter sp.]|nr:serine/threonine protein phosphatase [Conexibacter sp.]